MPKKSSNGPGLIEYSFILILVGLTVAAIMALALILLIVYVVVPWLLATFPGLASAALLSLMV